MAGTAAADRRELPPVEGVRYLAFCDMSGGSADSAALAIAHRHTAGSAVLDCLREVRAPHSPAAAVARFVADLERYHVRDVTGDRVARATGRDTVFHPPGQHDDLANAAAGALVLAAAADPLDALPPGALAVNRGLWRRSPNQLSDRYAGFREGPTW